MMNVAVRVGSLVVHHHLGLALDAVASSLRPVLAHNGHTDGRLVGEVIGVACRARTTGALGCELVDAGYGPGKVASERREIHGADLSDGYLEIVRSVEL